MHDKSYSLQQLSALLGRGILTIIRIGQCCVNPRSRLPEPMQILVTTPDSFDDRAFKFTYRAKLSRHVAVGLMGT